MKVFLKGQAFTLLFAALLSTAAAAAEDSMDHSGHEMSSQSVDRDELGRRLYDNKHKITPEMAGQLRPRCLPAQGRWPGEEVAPCRASSPRSSCRVSLVRCGSHKR